MGRKRATSIIPRVTRSFLLFGSLIFVIGRNSTDERQQQPHGFLRPRSSESSKEVITSQITETFFVIFSTDPWNILYNHATKQLRKTRLIISSITVYAIGRGPERR